MNISQVNYWLKLDMWWGGGGGSSMVGVAELVLEAPGSWPRMEVADVLQPAGSVAGTVPVRADTQIEVVTDLFHGRGLLVLPGLLAGRLLA